MQPIRTRALKVAVSMNANSRATIPTPLDQAHVVRAGPKTLLGPALKDLRGSNFSRGSHAG